MSEFQRLSRGLAVAAALAVVLALTGCGRKGPLDPPPGASLAGEQQAKANPMSNPIAAPVGGQTKGSDTPVGPNGLPLSPQGPKKHIFLDNLLN